MRALSLTEPFATLVAIGAKCWETRQWRGPYRGPIAIHAAKRFPPECRGLCEGEPFKTALGGARFGHLGHIIAIAELTDMVRITDANAPDEPERSFGDYTPGRFMWRLDHVRRLPTPIACKGALGLWVVPAETLALINDQLERGGL
jgi:hypothetical protein